MDYHYFVYFTDDGTDQFLIQTVEKGLPDTGAACADLLDLGWREIPKVLFDQMAECGLEEIDKEEWI